MKASPELFLKIIVLLFVASLVWYFISAVSKNMSEPAPAANPMFSDPRIQTVADAIRRNDVEVVREAIADGLPIDVPGQNGIRLSHLAVLSRSPFLYEFVSGGERPEPSTTPADTRILTMLIEAGIDLEATTTEKQTLTQIAISRFDGTTDHLQVLLDAGIDPNKAIGQLEAPPLIHAVYSNNVAAAALLLDHGADPNWSDPFSGTALHMAMTTPDLEMARLLLERGVDPRITTKHKPSVPELWCFMADRRALSPSAERVAEFEALNDLMRELHGIEFPCQLDGSPR